jgi:hypothetical protein
MSWNTPSIWLASPSTKAKVKLVGHVHFVPY